MTSPEYWNPLVPELTVTDVEQSLRFYEAAGFTQRFRRDKGHAFVYIEQGGAQLMLEQQHASAWNIEPLDRPLGRGVNFQIEVQDAMLVANALRAKGYRLFEEPRQRWYAVSDTHEEGQWEVLAQDPDGYLMRFVQVLGARNIA